MRRTGPKINSSKLTDTAVRFLKASSLGARIDNRDVRTLRAAADAQDRDLPSDQLACHILLREVRKRRLAATDAAKSL